MAADLYLHIYEGIEEKDLAIFFSNSIGSKYFNLDNRKNAENNRREGSGEGNWKESWEESYEKIAKTPNIWIGEVSWLKAMLFEDRDIFIPSTVDMINDIIGEVLPIINEELITKILNAFDLENKTCYELAKKEDVEKFLVENKGKRLFTVSW